MHLSLVFASALLIGVSAAVELSKKEVGNYEDPKEVLKPSSKSDEKTFSKHNELIKDLDPEDREIVFKKGSVDYYMLQKLLKALRERSEQGEDVTHVIKSLGGMHNEEDIGHAVKSSNRKYNDVHHLSLKGNLANPKEHVLRDPYNSYVSYYPMESDRGKLVPNYPYRRRYPIVSRYRGNPYKGSFNYDNNTVLRNNTYRRPSVGYNYPNNHKYNTEFQSLTTENKTTLDALQRVNKLKDNGLSVRVKRDEYEDEGRKNDIKKENESGNHKIIHNKKHLLGIDNLLKILRKNSNNENINSKINPRDITSTDSGTIEQVEAPRRYTRITRRDSEKLDRAEENSQPDEGDSLNSPTSEQLFENEAMRLLRTIFEPTSLHVDNNDTSMNEYLVIDEAKPSDGDLKPSDQQTEVGGKMFREIESSRSVSSFNNSSTTGEPNEERVPVIEEFVSRRAYITCSGGSKGLNCQVKTETSTGPNKESVSHSKNITVGATPPEPSNKPLTSNDYENSPLMPVLEFENENITASLPNINETSNKPSAIESIIETPRSKGFISTTFDDIWNYVTKFF